MPGFLGPLVVGVLMTKQKIKLTGMVKAAG
jgi:hypothetical protein